MPAPVTPWVTGTPVTAESLDLALYTCDGSGDNPNGLAFLAQKPILFEGYSAAATLAASSSGTQTVLSTSGSVTPGLLILDSAGYFGQAQDQPGLGYYQLLAAVKGSAGDGVAPGGWTLLSHFAAVAPSSTQTSVSADMTGTAQPSAAGTRQLPVTGHDCCAFFLDLVSVQDNITWSPAVTVSDSSSTSATLVVNSTGVSGETCRLCTIWAAASATSAGTAVFNIGGTYPWTAPNQVSLVTATNYGAGAGGGAGNTSLGGTEYGGGGGGAGEWAQGAAPVTGGSNYTVVVGSGGAGGTAPGSAGGTPGAGSNGGVSTFTGDTGGPITAHGGTGGGGGTGSADGAGGAGGTGSSATAHHDGGAGANGKTAVYGGGGGGSAGPKGAGVTATGSSGAPAVKGGGPGGGGGIDTITLVQKAHTFATGSSITVTMPSAIQAGNTVLAFVYAQGQLGGNPQDPKVSLNDGTPFGSPAVSADMTNLGVPFQNKLYNAFDVAGGETSVSVRAYTTGNDVKLVMAEVYEIAGLGPSPTLDVNTDHTQGGANPDNFYTSNTAATNDAPELWVAWTGAQINQAQAPGFTINDPAAAQNWNTTTKLYKENGGFHAGAMAAWQTVTKTGNLLFNGTFSTGVSKGTFAASYSTSAATVGTSPIIGPGGAGGAGLGDSNDGAAGSDGQVTLTWQGISGGGYGTPALPAPYQGWTDTTTLGTTSAADVNINGSTGITGVVNYLTNPPAFRAGTTSSQIIANTTLSPVTFTAGASTTVSLDNYSGWNTGSSTYTVARDGLYLFHGLVSFAQNSTGARRAGATINGTTYWGPATPATTGASSTTNVGKTQIFSLKAGDTVQLACRQASGGVLALSTTYQSRFLLAWLCEAGTPATLWPPPDITFRWASGMGFASSLAPLLQQYLAGGLGFLVNRPYFMGYQQTAQTGLTQSAFSTVTLDTVGCPVHTSDNGDNYSGWSSGSSNAYVAQEPGWYLVTGEMFAAAPSVNNCTVIGGILPSASGGVTPARTPDWYQQLAVTNGGSGGGGATIFGIQYMLTGEQISPQIQGAGYSGTYATMTGANQGGEMFSHLEVVWLSE